MTPIEVVVYLGVGLVIALVFAITPYGIPDDIQSEPVLIGLTCFAWPVMITVILGGWVVFLVGTGLQLLGIAIQGFVDGVCKSIKKGSRNVR